MNNKILLNTSIIILLITIIIILINFNFYQFNDWIIRSIGIITIINIPIISYNTVSIIKEKYNK